MSKDYFITGATGLIGTALVRRLHSEGHNIVAFVRNKELAGDIFTGLGQVTLVEGDVSDDIIYDGNVDFVIHAASPTDSRFFIDKPVETIESIILGTNNVLQFSKDKQVKSVLYLSSMEAYGLPTDDELISEDQYYPMSSTDVRNSYPIAKLMSENLSMSYMSEYSTPVKIVRIAQVIGNTLIDGDNRAISQFIRSAVNGDDINLATEGKSKQSYVSLDDTLDALLLVLHEGVDGEVYNIADETMYCSIKGLATFISKVITAGKVNVNTGGDIRSDQYAKFRTLNLDSSKLRRLGWVPMVSFEESIRRLAGISDSARG